MTGLLLLKEHLKEFYNKYSYWIRFVVRLLLVLCTVLSMNANIGYMAKLKNPVVVALLCFFGALLPDSGAVFLIGCVMVAHVYAVSMEMALITLMMILVVAVLYYGFKPGDSWLMVLTPLAFLFKVPYAVAFLVGLGGSLISVIPVSCGVFLYYLLMYIRQNAGVLTGEGNVDIVQRYSQIIRSVCFNQTMMIMIAACAVGIIVVYLIHRLSVDYAWVIAIVVGTVAQLLVIFVGDFVFGVSVSAGTLIFGLLGSVGLAMIYNFFFFSVDYTCTEYVQFEDDDYYFDNSGIMATGEVQVGLVKCTFSKKGKLKSKGDVNIDASKPMVALTFDDGPGERTGELLAQLEKYNAHATFFMQGKNIPGKEDFVKKMKETGCELGNHSYDHPQLTKLSADKIANQIGTTNDLIQQAAGDHLMVQSMIR